MKLAAIGAAATLAFFSLATQLGSGALAATPFGSSAVANGIVAALMGATLGGFLVAVLARAPAEICVPAASVVVIYAALGADLVARAGPQASFGEIWAGLSLAVVLMGVLLAVAGWLRVAEAIKFIPVPVSAGLVTGIGLLLMWSQLGPLGGIEGRLTNYSGADLLARIRPASLAVGGATMLAVVIYPRLTKRGQPALMALAFGTVLYHAVAWLYGADELGPTLGRLTPMSTAESTIRVTWTSVGPAWLLSTGMYVLPYSAFLALQAIMNAAVAAATVGGITGTRTDVNRMLKVQGFANVVCGAVAALPITTAASQSVTAARMKVVSPWIPAASSATLLVVVLVAGDLLAHIPRAVLAAILIMTGFGMIDRWARGLAGSLWRGDAADIHARANLAIVAAVAAAFLFGSVPLALLVGTVLAMLLLAVNLSSATTFATEPGSDLASTRVWPAEQAEWLAGARRSIAIFRPRGDLFFGTADQFAVRLEAIGVETRSCVLDLSRVTTLDATACQIVAAGAKKLAARGVTTVLAGVSGSSRRAQELVSLGLTHPDPKARWFEDLDRALEWVEAELLRERWPDISADAAVGLTNTPLAKGLSASDVEELRSFLKCVEVDAGPLFSRGDPGTSMYVIDEGFVEIRVGSGTDKPTRLAAFGPGSIFGEIAMLSSDERTADALCVKPTRLYELEREGLSELERRSPRLYARIIENLNVHLANRLIIATRTVQAQR